LAREFQAAITASWMFSTAQAIHRDIEGCTRGAQAHCSGFSPNPVSG